MTSRALVGAIAALLVSPLPGRCVAGADDPWTDRNGTAEAGRVIVSCLANPSPTELQHAKDRCIDEPLDVCADRHARNEMTLDECTRFASDAWQIRLDQQVARARAAAGPLARAFDGTQSWNQKDCDFQAPFEGSMHSEVVNECLTAHAGQRALELEALADEWETHPPDPPRAR